MKVKRILIVLCALVAALTFVSCKKVQKTNVLYRSGTSRQALTSSTKISLSGYSFDSFLERGLIKVTENREGVDYYGVLGGMGEVVLPVSYTAVNSAGDFLVAEGTDGFSVFSLSGNLLTTSEEYIEVNDVGGGYFSVTDRQYTYLFNSNGQNVLPGTQLDTTYEFSACGNFAIAVSQTRGNVFVFHVLTSDIVLSFFNGDGTKYSVSYAGDNDFIVVKNKTGTSSDYDLVLDRGAEGPVYYKQTVSRYTVGVESPVTLSPGRFIVQVANRYSVGVTEEMREGFSLNEGYHAVSYYKTEGKRASGALGYYVADASLAEKKAMPDGVSPLFTPVNGTAATLTSSGSIVFLNENAEVIGSVEDAVYQDVLFSGEVVTASKIMEDGVIRRGGFDKSGRVVVPFEYSYISAFVGDKAIATKNGKAYVVSTSGAETYVGEFAFPHYFDGFYQTEQDGFTGLTSFDGESLVAPSYQGIEAVRRYGNAVYVALYIGAATDVYRLS